MDKEYKHSLVTKTNEKRARFNIETCNSISEYKFTVHSKLQAPFKNANNTCPPAMVALELAPESCDDDDDDDDDADAAAARVEDMAEDGEDEDDGSMGKA
jgi:hypothetical protein